jgi:hypothetical protein
MKETGILFTPENIRSIREGRKTQTRRVIAYEWNHMYTPSEYFPYTRKALEQSKKKEDDFVTFSEPYTEIVGEPVWFYSWGNARWLRSPFGKEGDKLYIKEGVITHVSIPQLVGYYMDGCRVTERWEKRLTAMFMPKWAARTWLEITDVRVQKLQDISEEDAQAEGITQELLNAIAMHLQIYHQWSSSRPWACGYQHLWESINGKKHPWSSNPWVFALTFKLLEGK